MDKNAIKKYAIWARRELIERVSQRAMIYGITAKDAGDPNAESVNGHLLSQKEKRQRQALIRNIKAKGYEQVMEEVAYTWFNRFAALRFMEVNGYLPSHIRVFTNDAGEFKPQILAEAIHLELDGLDMNKVYELESANKSEELFKYLLIVQCNALNSILPGMFQRIDDYTELLLPDYLLREGSVIEQMLTTIPEEDWADQVQIIGWLYEAYNSERNEQVYDGTLSKEKISKDFLPAATTIFTPDWPVHYMVENSLGRLWLEGHPNDVLKSEWKYYLDEGEQEEEVKAQLVAIYKEYAVLKPEEIRVIDPCMGSGHILCVFFDVLIRIYEDYGYTAREATVKIVENNLWGLDVDDRAAQLSYFAVMMKARQYDRRFFSRDAQPHIYSIHESNAFRVDYGFAREDFQLSKEEQNTLDYLIDLFVDAKEYGSILKLEKRDYTGLKEAWKRISQTTDGSNLSLWYTSVFPEVSHIIDQAISLNQRYHVVATNPPYLGNQRFSQALDSYVKDNYSDVKSDLSMVMYKHALDMVMQNGFVSFITTSSWMFLGSFEKLRQHLQNTASFSSLVDFGTELFDGKVGHNPIVSWIVRKCHINSKITAIRLVDYCYSRRDEKETEYFDQRNRYFAVQSGFAKVSGSPIVYWASEKLLNIFSESPALSTICEPRQGLITGDNNRFLRLWYEVGTENTALSYSPEQKWYPINKGGDFRRWYGNREYVLNWENDGEEIKNFRDEKGKLRSRPQNLDYNFHRSLSWSLVTSGGFSVRYFDESFTFNVAGISCFPKEENLLYINGLLNSKIVGVITRMLNPTINMNAGDVARVPVMMSQEHKSEIDRLVDSCVRISKDDWDSFENSWDFQHHPLVRKCSTVENAYNMWDQECKKRFDQLKNNEEELNRIFIEIYGLQDELTPEVEDKDVTVRKADLQREIKSLISYAVGCMFGRYSLYKDGLIFAGEPYSLERWVEIMNDQPGIVDAEELQRAYRSEGVVISEMFFPDKDGILPITDDEYFEDDIVTLFVNFIETVYGHDTLEENLKFIADALGKKGSPREAIRNYFLNDFFADHCKIYQKRPIYWLFDSGKKNGFKCLIYMHRYQPDTIARIRTDYVHEQQSRYRTAIADLKQRINNASSSERVKLSKQLATLQAQAEEIRVYEEKIHHLADQMIKIDLDDGVKHNYEIFKDVLAKIK